FRLKARTTPFECFRVPLGLRSDSEARVSAAELLRAIFLDRHSSAELHIFGLVGDTEAARPDHPLDAIAAVEQRPFRQCNPPVHSRYLSQNPIEQLAEQSGAGCSQS